MLTDTMDTISARDPLSPVMDILMLMVMVIVPMDIMDMDTATANRFILLPYITTNGCACFVQVFEMENFDLRSTVP